MCEQRWYLYLITDLVLYAIGILLTIFWQLIKRRILYRLCRKRLAQQTASVSGTINAASSITSVDNENRNVMEGECNMGHKSKNPEDDVIDYNKNNATVIVKNDIFPETYSKWNQWIQLQCYLLIYGETFIGKIVLSLECICTLTSLGIYVFEATRYNTDIMICRSEYRRWNLAYIDVSCNIFFLVFFFIRLLAADSKLQFWLQPYTLIDVLTVPHSLLAVFGSRDIIWWSGLRFIRALWLPRFPNVLQHLTTWSTPRLRLVQLCTMFIGVWLTGSGLIHLLETSGDPWTRVSSKSNESTIVYRTLGDYLYFSIVTMSTVGYGDISPTTTLGRVVVSLFIMCTIAMFASFIPEIVDIMFSGSRYMGIYKRSTTHVSHIIVCGNIRLSTTSAFLADFFHEDRPKLRMFVVFIHPEEPDYELASFLQKYSFNTCYIKGTVMDKRDLERVNIDQASACLILADMACNDPRAEDAANTLRVLSLKNTRPNLRILVQLIEPNLLTDITNIPGWSTSLVGDEAICYSELQLGLLARSCLVPAYSTFITNLFTIRSERECRKYRTGHSDKCWINRYIDGVEMEVYREKLPKSLTNITFSQLFMFCYRYLELLTIAIEVDDNTWTNFNSNINNVSYHNNNNRHRLHINPTSQQLIPPNSAAYFICASFADVGRVALYCKVCHKMDEKTRIRIDKIHCSCSHSSNRKISNWTQLEENKNQNIKKSIEPSAASSSSSLTVQQNLYYQCITQEFRRHLIRNPKQKLDLTNHIIICVFAAENSPPIGLVKFVQILRSKKISSIDYHKLVFVGNDEKYFRKEWDKLTNFPNIQVVIIDEINCDSLSQIQVEKCHACIIMSCSNPVWDKEPHLVDKEVILTTLNIKRILTDATVSFEPSLNAALLITNLVYDNNAQFLDQEDEDDPSTPLYLTSTFASGCTFARTMLDSLLAITYFNPDAIKLMNQLTNGTSSRIAAIKLSDNEKMNEFFYKITISSSPAQSASYGDLLEYVYNEHNILLLGVYVDMIQTVTVGNQRRHSSAVISTNPNRNFKVTINDTVLCLLPIN